jgi:amino acid transporter
MIYAIKRILVGKPLKSREGQHVKIGILRGMAILTPDALSSVAYATDQMEFVLASIIGVGASASYVANVLGFSLLGTFIISGLALLLFLAYRNIIKHYPMGGGAYSIGLNDLGHFWGLSAASTLIIGYTLTVAVSIASGVDAIAPFIPYVMYHKLLFNVLLTLLIMTINLRGTSESAGIFIPFTYLFVLSIVLLGGVGIVRAMLHPEQIHFPSLNGMQAVSGMSMFLFLRMFANGCSALTGIEAVSNSVPIFKEPSSRRAQSLLFTLVGTLSLLFFIVSGLALMHGLQYNPNVPLIQQESIMVFGLQGLGYLISLIISFATMAILIIAANTAFTGCPALWSSMARDGFMPRWVLHKGDRLVYSNGILFLTLISLLLTFAFDAKIGRLIALYGVSVFYTFTVSQMGMVVRLLRERGRNWILSTVGSSVGLLLTAAACIVFGVTRFFDGAWLVLVSVPLMVMIFTRIKHHYEQTKIDLKYDFQLPFYKNTPGLTIVPIASVNKASVAALQYAVGHFENVIAVHVVTADSEEGMKIATQKIEFEWGKLGTDIRLIVIHSQYRSVAKRLQRFVEFELKQYDSTDITIVIPQFLTSRWWHSLLHNKTGSLLHAWLIFNKSVKVITVPFRLSRS